MKFTHLTRLAYRFFRAYCHPDLMENLEGDLEELHEERSRRMSQRKADWRYVRDVMLLFRPSIIRPLTINGLSFNYHSTMYHHYLKTGFRNLLKYKSYTLLNIFGLATGMAAAIILLLIVHYERSFDTFHPDHERIYRLGQREILNGEENFFDLTPTPVAPTLQTEIPEVISSTRFFAPNQIRLRYRTKIINPLVHFVDTGFVDLFDFAVLQGDLAQTLNTADRIALVQSEAERLFGRADPIGEVLRVVNDERQFTVGAVLADPPTNSSLQFEALMPWINTPDWVAIDQTGDWYNEFMTGFVKLTASARPAHLSEKLLNFKNQHYSDEAQHTRLHLRPLAKLRPFDTNNEPIIRLLGLIAIITLIIAGINFTNLATAQSLLRTREIGVRQALGSLRSQLVGQFLAESLLTTLVALGIGILLVYGMLPSVNRYFDLSLTFRFWQNLPLFGTLLAMGVAVGLLAGTYPARLASRPSPVVSLRGQNRHHGLGRWLQRGLVVAQYAASILLIAGTLVIWRQIQFMKSQDLRFDQQNVVAFSLWYDNYNFKSGEQAKSAIKTMISRLKNESAIAALTFAEKMPGRYDQNYDSFHDHRTSHQEPVNMRQLTVGNDYFKTLGINLVAGQLPRPELAPDRGRAVLINETAMHMLGWHDAEDKYLVSVGEATLLPVLGVVEDYHYQSLRQRIEPMIHFYYSGDEYYYGHIAARLQSGRTADGLAALEAAYQSLNPFEPFDYYFLDKEFDQMYRAQERLGLTATLFAGTAVVLASLGLLALAAFSARQRQQEVGVRKVLGASVTQIVVLLSRNFAGLVVIALVIAGPPIYYAADRFLQDFAYRIDISADIFIIAGVIALVMAGLSVSSQAFRAASANPVDALRDE